ncbi:MAG: hypothetical protein KDA91_25850, partial [Planctomycetaceae bacterium]|nr:hypothetical protein [Planctomycetaceae bacterium]
MTPINDSTAIPPPWMRWFVSDVSRSITDYQAVAPLGCHFYFDSDRSVWEITLFASATEIVGGPRDGCKIEGDLHVNLGQVIGAFDEPPTSWWQSERYSESDDLGSHISFEGIARGY